MPSPTLHVVCAGHTNGREASHTAFPDETLHAAAHRLSPRPSAAKHRPRLAESTIEHTAEEGILANFAAFDQISHSGTIFVEL